MLAPRHHQPFVGRQGSRDEWRGNPGQQGFSTEMSHGDAGNQWDATSSWQGELGPNLMPMTSSSRSQHGASSSSNAGFNNGFGQRPNASEEGMRESPMQMQDQSMHALQNQQQPPSNNMHYMQQMRDPFMQGMQAPCMEGSRGAAWPGHQQPPSSRDPSMPYMQHPRDMPMQGMSNMRSPQMQGMQDMPGAFMQPRQNPATQNMQAPYGMRGQHQQATAGPPMQSQGMHSRGMPNLQEQPPGQRMPDGIDQSTKNLESIQLMKDLGMLSVREPPVQIFSQPTQQDMRGLPPMPSANMRELPGFPDMRPQMQDRFDDSGGRMGSGDNNVQLAQQMQGMHGGPNANMVMQHSGSPQQMQFEQGGPVPTLPMHSVQTGPMQQQAQHSQAAPYFGQSSQDQYGQQSYSQAPLGMPTGQTVDMQYQQQVPVPQEHNMQRQGMQVIALPMGAPPPQGAIPMGPAPMPNQMDGLGQGFMPEPQAGMQMIAVPIGEAPPAGAVPIGDAHHMPALETSRTSHSDSTTASSAQGRAGAGNKAFKIVDPCTKMEVQVPGKDGGSRRMRIVDPKTGEELCL